MSGDSSKPGRTRKRAAEPPAGSLELASGPWSVTYERGSLRWLFVDGREVLRGIYGAVRDAAWGTIPPRYVDHEIERQRDGFRIRYTAIHHHAEIEFTWQCTIEADGPDLRFVMDGHALRPFLTNRIGLCVLHPDTVAGTPVTVETAYGRLSGRFPDQVAPVSPYTNIRRIGQRLPGGGRLSVAFSGDLFEMEDQRNWTDASFKTFSRPLALPAPWRIDRGATVRQQVTVEVEASGVRRTSRRTTSEIAIGRLDRGAVPAIGVASSAAGIEPTSAMLDRVRTLGLAHMRLFVALPEAQDGGTLEAQLSEARSLGIPVEVEIAAPPDADGLDEVLERIRHAGLAVARLLVFDRETHVTTSGLLAVARAAARRAKVQAPIGGGSRADFNELNQAGLPDDPIDVLAYRMTPQIHAVDDATIMESISGQVATVRTARVMADGIPIAVGPVTLKQLFDPFAIGPLDARMTVEATRDPRQASLFGAAWTLASIAALGANGVGSITYHRTAGPAGLQPGPDEIVDHAAETPIVHPVYHVLDGVATVAGGRLLDVTAPPGWAALAVRTADGIRVFAANLEPTARHVVLRLPAGGETRLWLLDDEHLRLATVDPEAFRSSPAELPDAVALPLTVGPYGVARLDRAVPGGDQTLIAAG